ncbi:hypothetical protein Tco_0834214 [Tanacetum coccineum]
MISKPARFVPYTEMLLETEGTGEYDSASYMSNHWKDYSKCAQRFVSDVPVLFDPKSMLGAIECLENPTATFRALSLKCYMMRRRSKKSIGIP